MGPQNPKEIASDLARDLSALIGELVSLQAGANQSLTGPNYVALSRAG